jgi:hypothetical protein
MFKKLVLTAWLVLIAALPAFATSVNVSTVAVAGSTVTVTTASAHGLAVNTGICITSTAACAVVATVPTSTTFTFPQPTTVTVAACASSCGTASLAPKIVILDVSQPSQAQQTIHYLLWLTTLTPLPRAATSAWTAGSASVGATTAQNNALASGSFIEVNLSQTFPSSLTTAQIQTFLQNDYTTRQAALAANTQPGAFYGSVWDGTAWTVQ